MAPDRKHHLEGTLSATNEFRVCFCDEYTQSIPAERFTGEADRKPLELEPAPDKPFLNGKPDASVKTPLSVKTFIDFKDGWKPRVFDFDFNEPSKEPAVEKGDDHGHGAHGPWPFGAKRSLMVRQIGAFQLRSNARRPRRRGWTRTRCPARRVEVRRRSEISDFEGRLAPPPSHEASVRVPACGMSE